MKRSIVALMMAAAVPAMLMAQAPAPDPNDTGDAPDHGVARLSLMDGSVSVRHGDAGDLAPGAINAPLVATDRVETADGSRAEVQFDAVNMIRLAPSTEVRLSELEYQQYQVQIAEGTVAFRVLRDNDAQVEISTPTVSVRPQRAGTYRVTVRPDGTTQITVRQGSAEIFGPRGSENLAAGETMEARGPVSDPEFQIIAGIPLDDWDRWNTDRDRAFQQTVSSRYVSPDVYGTESLDPYGQWQNDPEYGQVWVPTVAADWAPYQIGRWSYLDYYGWTWVSGDPWGWAPYHYGRWYHASYGWAWWPGAIGARYYWRPALVGFCGWGGGGIGVGFGFGFGNVGWVPLAPYEAFHPWYGRGGVRIVNNVNLANTYRNARFAGGVTGVRAADFGRGSIGRGNIVRPTSSELARGGMVNGALPFNASAQSRRFSDAQVSARGIPQTSANRQFYTSRPTGVARGNVNASGGAATAQSNSWRRFDPSTSQGGNRGAAQSGAQNGAVQRNGFQSGAQNGSRPGGQPNRGPVVTQPQGVAPRGNAVQPQTQPRGYYPQTQTQRPPSQQQPVRINPPIVQPRGAAPSGAAHPPSHIGNFGGAHSSGGGSRGGGGGARGGKR